MEFPPIEHYVNIKAICNEIAHIKQQRLQYRKSMTKEERRECNRHRFDNEFILLFKKDSKRLPTIVMNLSTSETMASFRPNGALLRLLYE
jgi:hypothetical protein